MLHIHDTGGAAVIKVSRSLSDRHVSISADGFTKYGNGVGTTPWKFKQVTADPIEIGTSNTTFFTADPNGNVTLAQNLKVEGDVMFTLKAVSAWNSPGVAGEVRVDAGYIYVCIATNSWRRVAHAVW